MKKQAGLILSLGLLLIFVAGCQTYYGEEVASVGATATGLNPDDPGVQDKLFVRDSLKEGGKQVEIGLIGLNRTHNLDIKLLAQRIVDDRASANADLNMIAWHQEISYGAPINYIDELYPYRHLEGDKFDQMYIRQVLQSNRDEIKRFRFAARNSRNTDLREFAGRILPVLEEHLRIAENISRMAALNLDVNEPAGAARGPAYRDPYYQGDPELPHQFNEETQ